ncbi:MAG: HAMP domain-containing histidine kinase [Cyanobacteria bacterium RUI128]|nr:HAMP domain-containing histidine kinase [Cyanobacteria bacterium RUI128]
MAKVLLVSDNKDIQTMAQTTLLDHEFLISTDETTIMDIMKVETPDIVMLDTDSNKDLKTIFRIIKNFQVIILLLMGEKECSQEILSNSHLFVSVPVNQNILKSTVDAGLRARKSLKKLYKSNQELANSLYQLNVLYSTSSQLAGSLSKNGLVDVLNEGIDKSLNSNISCTLSFKDDKTPVLLINSNCKLSPRLVEALKLRAVLNYKNSGMDITEMFSIDDIELEQSIKHSINEYDFEVLNYHKLLSYITLNDECHGYSEIFREKEFTSDDEKCFRTLVNQVTQPLKSATLYQEIARLERLKSDFISIVSHELKTPLTSIKNSLDIIAGGKTGDLTDKMKEFIDMARRNVKQLSRIINGLLDMSKIEAGKMGYTCEVTSIKPVINNVVQSLTQSAIKKDLNLNVNIDEVKDVYIDADRIVQVLSNLVTNAIKFSPNNGVIDISAKLVSADNIVTDECFKPQIDKLSGEYVQVCVSDQGIGIDKSDFTRIFDKFEQIESSLSREVGGTGLGLSIAKDMILDHNGAIWCSSVLNKGSSFCFVLPVADEVEQPV